MARNFSGSGQFFEISSALLTTIPISFFCLYTPSNLVATHGLIVISHNAAGDNRFSLRTSGTVSGAVSVSAGSAGTADSTTPVMSNGNLYCCIAVFASSTSRTNYLNNNSVSNATNITPGVVTRTNISGYYSGSGSIGNLGQGTMHFFAIWSTALTQADAGSLFAGASPRLVRPDALKAYGRMTGGLSPEPDWVQPGGWTITGSPTVANNTRIFLP